VLLLRSETLATTEHIDGMGFKIASASTIASLIQHALPGISADLLTPTPRGVPHRKDTFYFLLNQQDNLWAHVEQQQDIAFYWDNAPADLQVQVIAMGDA